MANDDWRSAAAYQYLSNLSASDLAFEFLRRNPDYRSDFRLANEQDALGEGTGRIQASPDAGGCRFLADPEVRADAQTVFWLPEVHAGTVILTSQTPGHSDTIRFAPETWAAEAVLRGAPDGSYVFLREGRVEHRLWMSEPLSAEEPVAAVVPLDESASIRADATIRFWRHVTGRRAHVLPALSGQGLSRLASSLRALDGRQAGATYRSIATVLFGSARVAAEAWKTASVRDTTIRLVRSGIAMMKDGYRKLLGPKQRE